MWHESIDTQGFAIIPGVLDDTEVNHFISQVTQSSLRRSRAGIRHVLGNALVAELARDPRLLETAARVLGGKAFPFRGTLFDKSPRANWLVAWHQDTALPLRKRHDLSGWGPWSVKDGVVYAHAPAMVLGRIVAMRIHLDDSTPLNGPLRVLPGTHTQGVLSDDEIHGLSTKIESLDCIVRRGGVVVMRPLLVHSSTKSQAEIQRRVLHIEYAASEFVDAGLELAVA
jgi:hypothetical protein